MRVNCSLTKLEKLRTTKVEELSTLNEEGRLIAVELKVVMLSMQSDERVEKRHKLYKIGIDLALFFKGKSHFCN